MQALDVFSILGVRVYPSTYHEVTDATIAWASQHESRSVFFANVHMLMEAHDHVEFRNLLNSADLVNPDGVPLVWALRMIGADAERVYGPECTLRVLKACEDKGIPVGFYGATDQTLGKLLQVLHARFPKLKVVYSFSPPFRTASTKEDTAIVTEIRESGADVLFVGLGCPKQERWIADHRGRVPVVMMGVGAAFDFIAKTKPQAPRWMMQCGLEWLFRLGTEPSRLLVRYLRHNPRFLCLSAAEIFAARTRP